MDAKRDILDRRPCGNNTLSNSGRDANEQRNNEEQNRKKNTRTKTSDVEQDQEKRGVENFTTI